ncbi:FecR family protein [Mucilaginibacter paludis]|uniref:Anti-FecI sigma factor, FecR n=1 Tax=Mucilaginibacter paludis DSM 18603 TaxID=714943 RepID=H1Y8Y0_9SPHI|nr:FecR family protein [Mucilaginibacter paludis]EHQ28746.1 anti-FecI sigma factor, FecR [Mucilaginibacter paludis DSM 18603]
MSKKGIKQALQRVASGTATEEDDLKTLYWLHYFRRKDAPLLSEEELTSESDAIFHQLMERKLINRPYRAKRLWPRVAAAASIVLCLSAGIYLLIHNRKTAELELSQKYDISPGGNKAMLTLSNGQKIILNGAKNGRLAIQRNVSINKTADGSLTYAAAAPEAEVTYNTLTTPRGGQYQLTLADGTRVWLNAASSITYPVAFNTHERKVVITGEAYLEVVHHYGRPFRVTANGQTIEDLGTHFNINAYSDDPNNKTTLLEGSIKVIKNGRSALLQPGQQAVIENNVGTTDIKITKPVDIAETIAWRNGQTSFTNADIKTVMRMVSRWYDVDVTYQGKMPDQLYTGAISRNANLSGLLKILALNDIHFELQGRKIIVKP